MTRQMYLNNSGHRWVNIDDNGNRDRLVVVFPSTGEKKTLAVKYWEAIGNFAVPYVRVAGHVTQLCETAWQSGEWMPNTAENRAARN